MAVTARSKLFIDQGRTTLYQLFRYIDQYRFNNVFIPLDFYNIHHTTNVTALSSVKVSLVQNVFLKLVRLFGDLIINMYWFMTLFVGVLKQQYLGF